MGFPIASGCNASRRSRRTAVDGRRSPDAARTGDSLLRDRLACFLALGGGAGLSPVAPGTAGALLAMGAAAAAVTALRAADGALVAPAAIGGGAVATVFGSLLLGIWAAGRAERLLGRHDDGRIVIDEIVGQWIALLPAAPFVRVLDFSSLGLVAVTAFVAFRGFDVWKPGAVGWAERRFEGGFGVMADDGVAGAFGAVGVVLVLAVHPPAAAAVCGALT